MKLGIVYKEDKIINHRSLLKVLLNPFLRCVGLQIGTWYDNGQLKGPKLVRCNKTQKIIKNSEIKKEAQGRFIDIIKERLSRMNLAAEL